MTYRPFFWYAVVALFAVSTGLLTMVPQIIAEHRLGASYAGIHKEINDDETYYVTRAHDIVDGHYTLGNPYLYEEKHEPPLQPWISDVALAGGSMLLFHDLRIGSLAWDFVFPAGIFILTYILFNLVTKRGLLSLGLASLMSIGINLGTFSRSPSPQLNFVFLLLFLIALVSAVTTRTRKTIILATLLLGALFYIYTYYWTYALILLGLLTVLFFVLYRKEKLYFVPASILAGGSILGIPYFLNLHATTMLPYYKESLMHVGLIFTHSPSGISIVMWGSVVLVLFVVLWRWCALSISPLSLTLASGVLAGMIAVNQHIITGINLEFSSHYYLLSMYADIFLLALCMDAFFVRTNAWRSICERTFVVGLLLFCIMQASAVVQEQASVSPEFVAAQRYAPTLVWLDAHTQTDDVVYADDQLSYLIPAYTHDNVFFRQEVGLYIMPHADILRRVVMQHYFDTSYSRESFNNIAVEREVFGNYYIDTAAHLLNLNHLRAFVRLSPVPIVRYPEADITTVIALVKAQQKQPFLKGFSGFRVDYIAWDRTLHPEWRIDTMTGVEKVFDTNGISVYAVSHASTH